MKKAPPPLLKLATGTLPTESGDVGLYVSPTPTVGRWSGGALCESWSNLCYEINAYFVTHT